MLLTRKYNHIDDIDFNRIISSLFKEEKSYFKDKGTDMIDRLKEGKYIIGKFYKFIPTKKIDSIVIDIYSI